MDTSTHAQLFRRDSLFNAHTADSLSHASDWIADLSPLSSSSLYVNTGSSDSETTLSDYARSIMNLAHEIYGDFPALEHSRGLSPDPSHDKLHSNSVGDIRMPEDADRSADFSFVGESDLLDALEEVAQQVSKLATPRPPSLSPLEWSHALDLPAGMLTPWEDTFDFDEDTMAIKDRERAHTEQATYAEKHDFASGSPEIGIDPNPHSNMRYQVITDPRLTPTLPSITHSPLSPRDIPLPDTPMDSDFTPTSYDTSSSSQSSRSKFRAGGFKDMFSRSKRSTSPSPVYSTFAFNDREKVTGAMRSARPDIRRLRSLLFKEAADEPAEPEVLSFLDI